MSEHKKSHKQTPHETPEPEPQPEPRLETVEELSRLEILEAELESAQTQIAELEKARIYQQAEFQNYRRRRDEEFVAQQKYIAGTLFKDLLPVLDNFERALQAAEQTQNFDKLINGVQGTMKQLRTFLEKSGIAPIEAVGKEFDPEFHEAIGTVEDSEQPPNTVVEELQRGYVIHERVLRPTLVKISGS